MSAHLVDGAAGTARNAADRLLADRLASGDVSAMVTPDDAEVLRTLGRRLRARREELRRSQADVAEAAGVHVTYLSGLERGLRNPSGLVLRSLCQALDLSMDSVFRPSAGK